MSGSITALANGNNVDANGLNSNFNALNNPQVFFTTPNQILSSVAFTSGQVQTFTAWGTGGIPSGALAILVGAFFTSTSTGVSITFYPNGGTSGQYWAIGNMQVASSFCNGFGIIPLDGTGKFNVKSNSNTSTVTVWMWGYIF